MPRMRLAAVAGVACLALGIGSSVPSLAAAPGSHATTWSHMHHWRHDHDDWFHAFRHHKVAAAHPAGITGGAAKPAASTTSSSTSHTSTGNGGSGTHNSNSSSTSSSGTGGGNGAHAPGATTGSGTSNAGGNGAHTPPSSTGSSTATHTTSHTAAAPTSSGAAQGSATTCGGGSVGVGGTIGGYTVTRVLHLTATAYGPSLQDNYPYGPTDAFGKPLVAGDVAVDPSVIALNTHLCVAGYKSPTLPKGGEMAVARDTGGAIKGMRIDIFMNASQNLVNNFGIQPVTVYVLK